MILTTPCGTFHAAETGNVSSADQAQIPTASQIVVQMSETAGTGGCTVDIEQQLPGMTQWVSISQTALALSTSKIVVVPAPAGLLRVTLSGNTGTVTVKYCGHFPS